MGRFDRAVADCDAAIERNPELGSAHLARGGIHAEQGAYEAARADFSRALQLDPANAAAYRLRGRDRRCAAAITPAPWPTSTSRFDWDRAPP